MQYADRDASKQAILQSVTKTHPYSPSIASSASSSSDSIFFSDQRSSPSSTPSSTSSQSCDAERANGKPAAAGAGPRTAPNRQATKYDPAKSTTEHPVAPQSPTEHSVAPPLRVHPRRTHACVQTVLQHGQRLAARPPPALVRQCERKDIFVESLVGKLIPHAPQIYARKPYRESAYRTLADHRPRRAEDTTTQMIEVIWPLSVVPPAVSGCDPSMACSTTVANAGRSLIDLRTFVQEVLKRSRTSYSTLQVALYYLILIKAHVPAADFTRPQPSDSHAARAMQCGRRMFLAALILASKYLQDRNYSARAWSKISGLRVAEINLNERAFVAAVDYRLHVPEARFQRWTDIVLKHSLGPSESLSTAPRAACGRAARPEASAAWRSLVRRLTPELDDVDAATDGPTRTPTARLERFAFGSSAGSPPRFDATLPLRRGDASVFGDSQAPATPKPRSVGQVPSKATAGPAGDVLTLPSVRSPKIPQLPTPQMTPRPNAFYTPAAGGMTSGPHASAMRNAMQQIHAQSFTRCTMDAWPCARQSVPLQRQQSMSALRHSSIPGSAWNPNWISSPESMDSDTASVSTVFSSRSSRSSSISSVSSGFENLATPRACNPVASSSLPPAVRSASGSHGRSRWLSSQPSCPGFAAHPEPGFAPASLKTSGGLAVQAARRCFEQQCRRASSPHPGIGSAVVTPKPAALPAAAAATPVTSIPDSMPPSPDPSPPRGAPESFVRGLCGAPAAIPSHAADDPATAAARALHALRAGVHTPSPSPPRKRARPSPLATPPSSDPASSDPAFSDPASSDDGSSGDDGVAAALQAAVRATLLRDVSPASASRAAVRPDPRGAASALLPAPRGGACAGAENVRLRMALPRRATVARTVVRGPALAQAVWSADADVFGAGVDADEAVDGTDGGRKRMCRGFEAARERVPEWLRAQ